MTQYALTPRIGPEIAAAVDDTQLFTTAFKAVPDPRAWNVRHDLGELLILAFVAVLFDANDGLGPCGGPPADAGGRRRNHVRPLNVSLHDSAQSP